MRLLYIHNVEVSEHTANLTQVISMCKAFRLNNLSVVLLLPMPLKGNIKEVEKALRSNYNIEDEIKLEFFHNFFKNKRIRKFTHHFFLGKYIRKIQPDFCYTRDVNFLSQCLKNGVKTVYESHNFKIHNGSKKLDAYLKRKLRRKARSKQYLFMVTISEMLKNYWVSEGVDKHKIVTLHDGFIEEKYKEQKTKAETREKLGLPLDEQLIMYTGNLYPNRGVDQVLKLAKEFVEQRFIVVGGPEKFKKQLEIAVQKEKINNIDFKGQVPFSEIHLYQFAADVNLGIWSKEVPTINYCSPLKVFEYMAVGRPIVSMGFPSIKEVLIDGENAFVSDPNSPEDFAKKLGEAIHDVTLSKELSEKARNQAFSEFTWTKRAEKILQKI
jgi:glycosyltransferase involved in cell wall biosynthesis